MRDATPRPRGVTLRKLDLGNFVEQTNSELHETEPDVRAEIGHEPYAAIEHDGHLYVVCNEGVGWEVTEGSPLELDLYARSSTGFGIFPRWSLVLNPEEVRAAMTDEEVDLADLIRTFGARLEGNFWTWHHTLATEVSA